MPSGTTDPPPYHPHPIRNVLEEDAVAVAADLEQILVANGTNPISKAMYPEVRVVDLPAGRYLVRFPAPSPTEKNSAALLIFMAGQVRTCTTLYGVM